MHYKIRNTFIPVPEDHRQPLLATLAMYDRGEDLTDSPLIQSKINLTHMEAHNAIKSGVDERTALLDRQKAFIKLYEDIKTSGYNGSKILAWFDNDGLIHLYDGYHRLPILEHLGRDVLVDVETEWRGIDGRVGKDFPLAEVLRGEHPRRDSRGEWLYQPVSDERVSDWNIDRKDSPQRLEHILQNLIGETVLDIGCSEGYFSREIAKRGYKVTSIDTQHGFIAAARYLSVLEGVSVDYHQVSDWKNFLDKNGPYDNVLFLSVIHNDMKIVGVDAGLKKLEAFRGKAKRVFLEAPREKGEREWMVPGFPQFNFFEEDSVEKIEGAMGMKATEMWSVQPGKRPTFTYDSGEWGHNPQGEVILVPDVNGNSMYVMKDDPIITPWIIKTQVWEPELTEFLKRNLKEGQTFVDVGANIGYYSLLASKLVGNTGKVYAFEPAQDSYEVLLKNIKLNDLRNVTPFKKAISSKTGRQKLFSYGSFGDSGRRGLTWMKEKSEAFLSRNPVHRESCWTLVGTTRLSDVLSDPPDFIKVDVEGGERDALEGMRDILRQRKTVLILEDEPQTHQENTRWIAEEFNLPLSRAVKETVSGLKNFVYNLPGVRWWDLESWIPKHRDQYKPLFDSLRLEPRRNIMEVGTYDGRNAVAMIKAAAQKVPEEEIHYYGFDLFEECTPGLTREEFCPALTQRPVALQIIGTNFGDLLNVPILRHYFGEDLEFLTYKDIKPQSKVLVGAGTLIGYTMPTEWYLDRDVTFLGTGSRNAEEKVNIPAKGFTRGKLTEEKTGIKALGDIVLLIDRIYGVPNIERSGTGIVLDKTDREVQIDLPSPDRFTTWVSESQLLETYNRIAGYEYIVTDKLHVAVVAESLHIPWVLWNHGDKTLSRTPHKFVDWAGMIGKERFVLEDIANVEVIKENADFSASEKQKDILEDAVLEIAQSLDPRSERSVEALIRQHTSATVTLFKGNTRKTLPEVVGTLPKMDLIYIDGGHSIETTRNDWKYASELVQKDTVVYFDDYNDEMPFIGSYFILGELDPKYKAEVLPNTNYYKRPFGRLKCQLLKVEVKRKKPAVKTEHFRFHLMGLPHSRTVKNWGPCAFTQLAYRLSKMLHGMGHEVYHYGTVGSDLECTEHIDVLTEEVQRQAYGDWNQWKQLWIHNGKDLAYTTFRKNAIEELQRRKEPGDILLISNGNWLREISDVAGGGIATVEPFVGYLGFFAKYKVFPSYAWMHHMSGKLSATKGWKENFACGNWYDAVIPHFFDPADHTFCEEKGDYFLYIGRLIQRKGIHIAVDLCKRIGAKLVVGGQPIYPEPPDKYEWSLKSVGINQPHVEYVGVPSFEEADKLRGKAKGIIIPSLYTEPFGMVVVEALLSGTPVITTDWGAFPEIVKHGEVGYRCRTMDDFIWAANNIHKISPAACRGYAVNNYSMERISKAYQEYFTKIMDLFGKGWYAEHPERNNLDWLRRY